jgi:hypothetical protein
MKTGIAEAVLVTMSLALAGCEIATIDKTDTNLYTLNYQPIIFYSPEMVLFHMNSKAGNLCPKGWEKLNEIHEVSWSGTIYEWEIRCF